MIVLSAAPVNGKRGNHAALRLLISAGSLTSECHCKLALFRFDQHGDTPLVQLWRILQATGVQGGAFRVMAGIIVTH